MERKHLRHFLKKTQLRLQEAGWRPLHASQPNPTTSFLLNRGQPSNPFSLSSSSHLSQFDRGGLFLYFFSAPPGLKCFFPQLSLFVRQVFFFGTITDQCGDSLYYIQPLFTIIIIYHLHFTYHVYHLLLITYTDQCEDYLYYIQPPTFYRNFHKMVFHQNISVLGRSFALTQVLRFVVKQISKSKFFETHSR